MTSLNREGVGLGGFNCWHSEGLKGLAILRFDSVTSVFSSVKAIGFVTIYNKTNK